MWKKRQELEEKIKKDKDFIKEVRKI